MILPCALEEHVPEHVTGQIFLQHPEAREMEEKVEGSGQDENIYRQVGSKCQTVTSEIFAPSGHGVTHEETFVPSNLRPLIFSKPNEGFHMANYSLQTGEEFAVEFVKEASRFVMGNSQGRSGLSQVTVPKGDFCETNPYVYEELTGILGIERMASGSNSDISMLTGKRANLGDIESNCDPLYTESAQGTQIFGSINNGEFQSDERPVAASAVQAEFQHMPYSSTYQSYLSGPSEDSCTGKVKFMCSFGGKILPRPSDGKLRYAGGETRIITVNKDIGYGELMQKMKDNYGQALMLKYQLPDEDLDALVSVSSDEDLENMMEEYKRLEGNEGSSRLRVFLFTVVDDDLTHFDSMTDRRKSEQKYVDAVNGIPETGSRKHADSTAGASSQQLENLIGLDFAEIQNTTSRAQKGVVVSSMLSQLSHDVAKVVHIPGIPPHSSKHTISSASSGTKSIPPSFPLPSQPIHFKQSRVADSPLHTFPDQLLQGDGQSSSLVHPPELDYGGPITSSSALSQNGLHYKFTESRRISGSTNAHQDLLPPSYLDSMYHADQGFIDAQLPRVESHGKLNWPQEQFEVSQPILNIQSDDQLRPVDLHWIAHQVPSTVHQPLWQHNLDTDQYIYNQTDYIQQSNSGGELVQESVQQHSMQVAHRNISQLPNHDAAVFRHTDQALLHQDDAYGGPYMHKSVSTEQLEPGVTAANVLQQVGSSPPSPRQVGRGQQHVQGPCPPNAPFVDQHYSETRVQCYSDQPGRAFNPSTSPCNNEQLPEQFGYRQIFLHEQLPHPEEWFACQQAIPYEQDIHQQASSHVHSDTVLQTHVMKPVNPMYEGIPMSQAHHSDGSLMPKASCVGSDTFQEGFMPFQDFQEIGDLSIQVDNQGSQSQSIISGQQVYAAVHMSSGSEEHSSAHLHFHGSSDEIDGSIQQKTLKQEENKTQIVVRTRKDHFEVNYEEESSELSRSSHAKPAISYTGMDFPEDSSTFLLPCVGDSYQAFEKIENVEPFAEISYQHKLANPAGQTGAMGIVTDALQASELTGRINQLAVPWSGSNAQELRTAHPLKEHAFGHRVANINAQLPTVDQTLLEERLAEMSLNAHLSKAGAETSIPLSSPEIWWGGMGLDRGHIKAEPSIYALGETRNLAEGLPQNASHLIVNEMSRPVDSDGMVLLDEGSNILTSVSEHHCVQLLGKSLIDDDVEQSAYLLSDNITNARFVDELSSSNSVAMAVSAEGINQTSDLLNHDVIKGLFPQLLTSADDKAGSVHVYESSEKDISTHLKNEGVALDHVTCQHHSDEEVKGDSKVVEDVGTSEALRPNIFPALTLPVCEWDQAGEDVGVEQTLCEKVTEVVDEEAITAQDSDFEEAKIEDSDKDEPISDAAIAEAEAIGHGLQIIKNADLEELRELGSGTFGTVYHGKWRGSDVAIKRIKNSCFMGRPSEQERLRDDFWREARMLAHLHHPNVVAFYGVVPDGPGGTLATVTEYMVNGSLKQVLQRKDRTIDRRKRLLITMDAAFGMEYLHGKNIVHFDLKCENLLVNMRDPQRPICKVGDLGLSKIKHQTLVSGGVRGTLPWMAPELLNGSSSMVSEKVDVFSFGIVMWELLTGEEPYANMHYGAIIGGIVNNTLRPPVPNWCDPAWRSLMEKCWSADPAARPSFTEIANQLRATATSLPLKGQSHQAQVHGHS